GRQNVLVPAALGITALGGGLDAVALWAQAGINGVARATFVAHVANGMLLLWLAFGGLEVPRMRRLEVLVRTFLPLATAFAIAWGLDRLIPWSVGFAKPLRLLRLLLIAPLFLGAYGLTVLPL